MLAGVYNDVFQGLVMMGAALAVFLHAILSAGGPRALAASLASSPAFGPKFLEPLGRIPATTAFGLLFVFGVGTLGQPHLVHKFFMLREPRQLRFLPLVLAGAQSLCLLVWIGIGLAVPALVARGELPALASPDDATPVYLLARCPGWLAGVVLAGALAAIMSTANSFLVLTAAAAVRDLPRAFGRPLARELAWSRLAIVVAGFAALGFARLYDDLVAVLGTFSFGTLGAALAPVLVIGLPWRRVGAGTAFASIATGLLGHSVFELLGRGSRHVGWLPASPLAPGVPPAAAALLLSLAVVIVGGVISRPSEQR